MASIYTLGHSTRTFDEFLALLRAHGVNAVVDVRRFPASRRHPHFNRDALAESLHAAGIGYHWLPELGGRRSPRSDSRNTAWRHPSFRGYADYMETPPFRNGMNRLEAIASGRKAAILCAEALWWRCHRSLIADDLRTRGIDVLHIVDAQKTELHPYTSAARVIDGRLTYTEDRLI